MFQLNRHFKQFAQLSLRQKFDLGVALCRLTFVVMLIKIRSIDWFLKNSLNNNATTAALTESEQTKIQNIQTANGLHEMVRLASRILPFACECVPRSLVLRDMLRARGITAFVKLGVSKDALSMQSHAWVEVYDEAICEDAELKTNFKPITPQ